MKQGAELGVLISSSSWKLFQPGFLLQFTSFHDGAGDSIILMSYTHCQTLYFLFMKKKLVMLDQIQTIFIKFKKQVIFLMSDHTKNALRFFISRRKPIRLV